MHVSNSIGHLASGVSSQEFWLPDGIGAISSVWAASLGDVTDKLPGPRPVCADVQVDPCEVVVPGVASAKDGSSRVARKRFRERCQSWLCTETSAIDLMFQLRLYTHWWVILLT
jgi:hypothetical protein